MGLTQVKSGLLFTLSFLLVYLHLPFSPFSFLFTPWFLFFFLVLLPFFSSMLFKLQMKWKLIHLPSDYSLTDSLTRFYSIWSFYLGSGLIFLSLTSPFRLYLNHFFSITYWFCPYIPVQTFRRNSNLLRTSKKETKKKTVHALKVYQIPKEWIHLHLLWNVLSNEKVIKGSLCVSTPLPSRLICPWHTH